MPIPSVPTLIPNLDGERGDRHPGGVVVYATIHTPDADPKTPVDRVPVLPSIAQSRTVLSVATTAKPVAEPPEEGAGSAQLDDRQLRAWRGMLRIHATLTKALDAQLEAAHGLALSSYEVLMYLHDADEGRMRMSELATTVILSRSGLTRLVDRLERDGLIERQSCASDARGAYASLTDAGRRRLGEARATHLAGVRSLFLDHLGDAELDALGAAWERVLPGVGDAAGPRCA
jgi:DNA-binding MarR family transcriptional regulator